MYVFRSLGFLRDFLLRDCDTTYFGPAILHYVNRGIGNDCKTHKKPSDLITMLSRVKINMLMSPGRGGRGLNDVEGYPPRGRTLLVPGDLQTGQLFI